MILSVENLVKSYGKHSVLKGINFSIEVPEVIALVGPNGAGKSTLLNAICNLIPINEGTIRVLGFDHKDPKMFHHTSFLKDATVLYPYLTGLDHLYFVQRIQKLSKTRVDEVTLKVGIKDYASRKVSTYSTGMKQKLLLAMALMNQPQLLIMDEPLNGLDPTSIISTRNLIKELHQEGTCILLSSHTLSEIDLITKKILFLDQGKVYLEDLSLSTNNAEKSYLERYQDVS
jgi:ABC-2 type transport system ATP-binding protein